MSDTITIRVHYQRPGVTGEVNDFVSFRCKPDQIPSNIQNKAIQSVVSAHDVQKSAIDIEEIEYREG